MVTLKMQGRAKRVSSVGSQKDGPEKTIKTGTDEGKGSDGQGEPLLLRLQKRKTFVCYSREARGVVEEEEEEEEDEDEDVEEGGAVNRL